MKLDLEYDTVIFLGDYIDCGLTYRSATLRALRALRLKFCSISIEITVSWKMPPIAQANIARGGLFYGLINTFTLLGFDIYTKKTIMFKKN